MPEYWSGVQSVTEIIAKVKGKRDTGARKGIMLGLRNTLNESNKHVPHEEGDLERDGGISMDDTKLRGAVSYGRSADTRKYAVPQHEILSNKHDAGRTAKFLENAVNSTREENLQIIATATRAGMGT